MLQGNKFTCFQTYLKAIFGMFHTSIFIVVFWIHLKILVLKNRAVNDRVKKKMQLTKKDRLIIQGCQQIRDIFFIVYIYITVVVTVNCNLYKCILCLMKTYPSHFHCVSPPYLNPLSRLPSLVQLRTKLGVKFLSWYQSTRSKAET